MIYKSRRILELQLFAEEGAAAADTTSAPATAEKQPDTRAAADTGKDGADTKTTDEKKYSDKDLDEIIDKRFARWQKEQQKAVDEAKKLAEMNAQQKAEYERDQLQKELDALKKKDALAEMSKAARKMLSESNINVPDDLLSMLVTTDAESTKVAVDSFAKLFKEAVENSVKERLRGEIPTRGTGGNTVVSEIDKRIQKYS